MPKLFSSSSSSSTDGKKILVEHCDNGHKHKRIITFQQTDLHSLKKEVVNAYGDILPKKIAKAAKVKVETEAVHEQFFHLLCLKIYNKDFEAMVDLIDVEDIQNKCTIIAEVIGQEHSGSHVVKPNDEDVDSYDIALQIKDMKIHIRAFEHEHAHYEFPFWVNYDKLKPAENGFFPPGYYRIWSPVSSQGQGYISIDPRSDTSNGIYPVTVTGMTTIIPSTKDGTALHKLTDGKSKLQFANTEAYLCYRRSDQKVVAVVEPNEEEYQMEFEFRRYDPPQNMYVQIGHTVSGKTSEIFRYLVSTDQNTMVCVERPGNTNEITVDPASMFLLYKTTK